MFAFSGPGSAHRHDLPKPDSHSKGSAFSGAPAAVNRLRQSRDFRDAALD
jgi:hypothetical protein